VLLVTHGLKDTTTAVYRNTVGRAKFLQRLGHDAQVLTPTDVGLARHGRLLPVLYPFAVAWRVLRQEPFDTIAFHSHTGWVYQAIRALLPSQRRTEVAVTFHGLDILYVKALADEGKRRGLPQTLRFRLLHQHVLPKLARWSCRHAARVFCMNDRERSFLLEHRWTDPGRLRWMPNCVEEEDFVRREAAAGPVRLLMVAQWLPVKGTAYLVQAFTSLVRRGLQVQLVCAGTRCDPLSVLRDFPEDVRSHVTVASHIPHGEVHRFYAAADIFVLPSISEGFSVALLEAMAAGLAIVTTTAGAALQILEQDRDALIVPPADAAALESAIASLVADADRRRACGERARARARVFTCERVLAGFAEDLLGARDTGQLAAVGGIAQ
jgi:glycosyltransferase involved in cell wall biosynthesis